MGGMGCSNGVVGINMIRDLLQVRGGRGLGGGGGRARGGRSRDLLQMDRGGKGRGVWLRGGKGRKAEGGGGAWTGGERKR